MKIGEILKITRGKLVSGKPDVDVDPAKISTDSRTIRKGEFFLALKGPNFDGSFFLEDAFRRGAIGALTAHRPSQVKYHTRIIIQVKDAQKALQDIAGYHRLKFKIPVIGVTGSNGKTTTKDMIWDILSVKYNVLRNEGTKNNHVGLPQTLLKLKSHHDICVLEMGMNHRREIGLLVRIAKPNIAVITNIGPSHLEFLGDLKSIFEAKKEVLASLKRRDLAVLNGDDEFLCGIRRGKFDILRFGFKGLNDFRATDISRENSALKFLLNGKIKFKLNILGLHNVYNALAAIAVGKNFGISYGSMARALYNYKPSYMRLNLKEIDGIKIIDDSYNSNPLSMECALEALENYPARARWVVSGDMLELGRYGRYFHKRIGERIARSNVDGLLTFGELSKATHSQSRICGMDKNNLWHASTHDEIANILRRVTKRGDVVLIKGSRTMRMEEVINKLKTQNSKLKS